MKIIGAKLLFGSLGWFGVATLLILVTVASGHQVLKQHVTEPVLIADGYGASDYQAAILASYEDGEVLGEAQTITGFMETADARALLVTNFLSRYNSPLKPHDYYGAKLVEIADRYGIDFRLLPAIAMQESQLCKRIPVNSYNCLGFGVHSRGTLRFESYEAGFERAARELRANYIDEGLVTPEQIMRKYTPKSSGSWAAAVNQFMTEMRYDDRDLGRTKRVDADLWEFVQPD